MGRSSKRPETGIVVRTYAELDRYIHQFAAGKFGLLILVGGPGLQKTRKAHEILGPDVCWIESNATAFGIYCRLFEFRDQPVVIDDVDSLFGDRAAVRLLKCLCQTEERKVVAWQSYAKALEQEGIPRRFSTRSPVIIIANDWRTLNANVRALEDRGHLLLFEPSALEVHLRTAGWFQDQEVFDFVAENLHLIDEPSMRHYVIGQELKTAGFDWKSRLRERWQVDPKTVLVAKLKADPSYATEQDRVRAFTEAGGGSRATYFNHAKKLQPAGAPPKIVLKKPVPEAVCAKIDVLRMNDLAAIWQVGNGVDTWTT